jgi:hypothetical protein
LGLSSVISKQMYGLQSSVLRTKKIDCSLFMVSLVKYTGKIGYDEKATNNDITNSRKTKVPTTPLVMNYSLQVYQCIPNSLIRSIREKTSDINACVALLNNEFINNVARRIDAQTNGIVKWNSVLRNMSIDIDIANCMFTFTHDDKLRFEVYNRCEASLRHCIHSNIFHKDTKAKLEFYFYIKPENVHFAITPSEYEQLRRAKNVRTKGSSKGLNGNELSSDMLIHREKVYIRVWHRCFGMSTGNTTCIEKRTPLFVSVKKLLVFIKATLYPSTYTEIYSIVKQVIDNVIDERGDTIISALVGPEALRQASKRPKKQSLQVESTTTTPHSTSSLLSSPLISNNLNLQHQTLPQQAIPTPQHSSNSSHGNAPTSSHSNSSNVVTDQTTLIGFGAFTYRK